MANEAIIAKLVAMGTVNQAICQQIADEFDVKEKSVITMAVRHADVTYQRKERVSKSGEKVESKTDLVTEIAGLLGVEADSLDGLSKATKTALQVIRDSIESAE